MFYTRCAYVGQKTQDDKRMHGHGIFTFANGNRYVGTFHNGTFHGEGIIFFTKTNGGGQYRGTWHHGKSTGGQYIFSDGLEFEMDDWGHCTDADRRLWSEYLTFINPPLAGAAGNTIIPNYSTTDGIPPSFANGQPRGMMDITNSFWETAAAPPAEWVDQKTMARIQSERNLNASKVLHDAEGLHLSAEETASLVKLQALQRGRMARKAADAKNEAESPAAPAAPDAAASPEEDAENFDGLELTEEDVIAITKLQAIQRGKLARKDMGSREKSVAETTAAPEAEAEAEEEPPIDLTSMSPEDVAAITRLQALQRGRQSRKETPRPAAASASSPTTTSGDATAEPTAPAPTEEEEKDLSPEEMLAQGLSEDEVKRIVKIQAMHRGRLTRKAATPKKEKKAEEPAQAPAALSEEELMVAGMTKEDIERIAMIQQKQKAKFGWGKKKAAAPAATDANPAEAPAASSAPAKEDAKAEEPISLDLSEEEVQRIVQLQAVYRGHVVRKGDAKKDDASKPAEPAAPPVDPKAPPVALEELTEDDVANITRIQAAYRGHIARGKTKAIASKDSQ